jgi:hypothetical protein
VGADALQDVIGASATMAGAWSLHGTPHNPQIVPFAPQGAELFHAPFSGSAYTPPLADPLAVAADFDNDGQSDVAIVSSNREECFVLARSFQSTGFGANPAVPVTMTGVLDGYNLTFGISVATGWVDEPTHAVFEVWLRDQPPSYVQPGPWLSDTVEIDGDGSHPITLTGNLPTGFDAGTGAFYLRAYVKHVGTTTQRTPATFWVHSFSQGTLRYILCSESDPYEPEGLCPPDDGPLIQGFNRRASVRPFEAGISPYGNNTQIPP